jgi:manganese transport protein
LANESSKNLLRRIGPGLVTAAVVLGPGTIVASSRAGAESGYGLVWVLVIAAGFMMAFTAMGARLGCALDTTPLQFVAQRWGRPLAALTGLTAFLVAAGFQFGNNIGVSVAMGELVPLPEWVWPIGFTILSIIFLFSAKHLYKLLERTMMVLVAVMIVSFVANLFFTGFSPGDLVRGLVPSRFEGNENIVGRAMFATTFSVVAAFYQAYLVQAKGWKRADLKTAVGDAWIGITILGGISLVIMIGAAEGLRGSAGEFGSIGELAEQLRGVLGPWATVVFCIGLGAASFSSFIANALIGGTLLADGFGADATSGSRATRACTTGAMLIGCGVAVAVMLAGEGGTQSLLIAQSSTLIAAPLCALLLVGLSSSGRIMKELRNSPATIVVGLLGLGLIAWLSIGLSIRLFGE